MHDSKGKQVETESNNISMKSEDYMVIMKIVMDIRKDTVR